MQSDSLQCIFHRPDGYAARVLLINDRTLRIDRVTDTVEEIGYHLWFGVLPEAVEVNLYG